ncbi:MAG TPA: monovalent cation/H(+) antiporter subunit G [Rubrobacteraceae bacterium]|nr:monovalent cation/H(+) antiporter subunit G [Rubrobacteraceae bacterium]
MQAVIPYLADALVIFGTFVVTIGVYGIIRMPDTFTRLHAASKAVFLGLISLLVASTVTGEPEIIFRVILIAFFLLMTTPVSAHVIGKATLHQRERMQAPAPVDESGSHLNEPDGT